MLASFVATAADTPNTLSGLNVQGFEQKAEGKALWRNNPFIQPANDVAVSELDLSGIVYNDEAAAAIINGEIVKAGDKMGYNEIVAVEKEHVILRNENGLFRLSLRGGGS